MKDKICPDCGLPMLESQYRHVILGEDRHTAWQCIVLLKKELEYARKPSVAAVYGYEAGLDEGRRECAESLLAAILKHNKKSGWQVVHVDGEWQLGNEKGRMR